MVLCKARLVFLAALSLAALVGSLGMTALPASAATVANPLGSIVCSGDLCIQTQSVNGSNCTAVVKAWAFNRSFTGHFEMAVPARGYAQNSRGGDRNWQAGGPGYDFTVRFFGSSFQYQGSAWRHNPNGGYSRIGFVPFAINVPSFCS
jgi:hypothetical protein